MRESVGISQRGQFHDPHAGRARMIGEELKFEVGIFGGEAIGDNDSHFQGLRLRCGVSFGTRCFCFVHGFISG